MYFHRTVFRISLDIIHFGFDVGAFLERKWLKDKWVIIKNQA